MPLEHRHCGKPVSFAEDMLRKDARSTVSRTLLVWYDTGAEAYSFVEPSTATKDRTRRCTRAGGNAGPENNAERARRVNLVVLSQMTLVSAKPE